MHKPGRLVGLMLSCLLAMGPHALAQEPNQSRDWTDRAIESLSVEVGARTIAQKREYGNFGYGRLSLGLFRAAVPALGSALFAGEIRAFALAGTGSFYKVARIGEPLPVRLLAEAGLSVPLVNISNLFNLRSGSVLEVGSAYQYQLVRNYRTGHHIGVRGADVTLSLSVPVSDYLSLNAGFGRSILRRPAPYFLWSTDNNSFRLGIVVHLGEYTKQVREGQEALGVLTSQVQTFEDRMTTTGLERDSLLREVVALKDSTDALRAEIGVREHSEEILQRTLQSQRRAESFVSFDETQKAATSIIRIDKQLFENGDLLEEDYLKAILAIVSNAGHFAWEILYREASDPAGVDAKSLAEKIRQFFEIYDSSLKGRLRTAPGASLRTQFEIRCLGRVSGQPLASTPN